MSSIRVHKEINLLPIQMGKENLVNVFYGLVEIYNKQIEYKHLELTKQDIWELSGLKGKYNSIKLMDIIKELTKPTIFSDGIIKISGSIFVTEELNNGNFKIYASEPYRPYLFYKKDIDLMTKAKKRKKLSVEELDYWERVGKKKKKFLVLLKKADLLGISGKYNKRLYALLSQFNQSKKYIVKWNDFREILEIPKSYKSSDIETRIFLKAKEELLKVGLKITKINKIKKGKSIERIEISYKHIENKNTEVKPGEKKALREQIREPLNTELVEYKKEILEIAKIKYKNDYQLRSEINNAESFDLIKKLVQEYNLIN